MTDSIASRLASVRERVAAAATRSGRDPEEITLVAVGKTFAAPALAEVVEAGVVDLGENRVQEMVAKAGLVHGGVRWHFVGSLQRNKVKDIVGIAHLIHSLDRPSLAAEISKRAGSNGTTQRVLIEVNLAGESSKGGADPSDVLALAEESAGLEGLEVGGVMAIPPLGEQGDHSRRHFEALRKIRDDIARSLPGATDLSMGMSRDFEVAIEEGATLVRVGEAIFGPR